MPATSAPDFVARSGDAPVLRTEDLFGSETEVVILHHGTHYRLRITRQDKLILTK